MSETAAPSRRRRWLAALPLIVFVGLAALLLVRLLYGGDASRVPPALIGQSAPGLNLPASTERRASPTPICAKAMSSSSTSSPRGASRAAASTNSWALAEIRLHGPTDRPCRRRPAT